jgi:serine/tyrosine/threonine adenylyltransferase
MEDFHFGVISSIELHIAIAPPTPPYRAMSTIAQPVAYAPDPAITEVADFLGDPVSAADFPETKLRFRNDRWAAAIGLADLTDEAWLAHFGRFVPLAGNLPQPLALRYHGHQFRNYNPDIGDGRLTLKGAVREILATEMLEALGVNTSKTFSVIETGEALHRGDEPSPTRSAVLVRLSHGHIRIGSFQRLAALGDEAALRRLTDYALLYYYGEPGGDDAPARLLSHVAKRGGALAASYMAAGFVHGVLNSDNINISGESFDYGPWRFTPLFDPSFTAAYFDESGLYAFGRQAEAIHWDVVQLGNALTSIAEIDALNQAVGAFAPAYQSAIADRFLWRLGVTSRGEAQDLELVRTITMALDQGEVSIDRFFFDWAGGARRGASPADAFYAGESFAPFAKAIANYTPARSLTHPYWHGKAPCSMHIEEVEAIWAPIAERDDWNALIAKVEAVRGMGEAMSESGEI